MSQFHDNLADALIHCCAVTRRSSAKLPAAERPTLPELPQNDDDSSPTEHMTRTEEMVMRHAGVGR